MSAAAERYVDALVHPKVKGGTRALLKAIAAFILEGQTTTPLLVLEDLARQSRQHRRTVMRGLDVLQEHRVIDVVEGGRGKKARYELVGIAGARPLTTSPLPLVGAVPPRRSRPQPGTPDTPSLFDPPVSYEAIAKNVGQFVTRWRQIVRRAICHTLPNVGQFVTRCRSNVGQFVTRLLPQGVDDQRARDVHTSKKEYTHTARELDAPTSTEPPDPEPAVTPPPLVILHAWHAWCGPVCVPKKLHQSWVSKGYAAEWLFAFYARRCATVSPEEARHTVDEFKFWRTQLADVLTPPSARGAPPSRAAPAGGAPAATVSHDELQAAKLIHARQAGCQHTPPCATWEVCVRAIALERRAS